MDRRYIVICSCQKIKCVFDDYTQARFFAKTHISFNRGHCIVIETVVVDGIETVVSDKEI